MRDVFRLTQCVLDVMKVDIISTSMDYKQLMHVLRQALHRVVVVCKSLRRERLRNCGIGAAHLYIARGFCLEF